MSGGISVHIKVHLAPESVDRFLSAFKKVFDAAATEPKCTFFELYRDPENPGEISWVENWYVQPPVGTPLEDLEHNG
jgi:quinol monooxygenase YgiN